MREREHLTLQLYKVHHCDRSVDVIPPNTAGVGVHAWHVAVVECSLAGYETAVSLMNTLTAQVCTDTTISMSGTWYA